MNTTHITTTTITTIIEQPNIKHLVISGGGPTGIKALGALKHLEENGFWNINHIQSIYATSAGAIIAVLLCLRFDWQAITDYVIYRPWHETYNIEVTKILEAYSKKGIFDDSVLRVFFKPFFDAKDLSMDMSLTEFFAYSNIELHVFSLELNRFEIIDISYKTHPDISILTAIHMTSALPIIITPVCIEDKCYVDGGVICNYPLNYCLNTFPERTEILGVRNKYELSEENNIVDHKSTILEYMIRFINKFVSNADTENKQSVISNEISYKTVPIGLEYMKSALCSVDVRKQLLNDGIRVATEFLAKNLQINDEDEDKDEL